MFADLRRAFALLTVLPVRAPAGDPASEGDETAPEEARPQAAPVEPSATLPRPAAAALPGRSMAYYPLVGVVIGGILAGVVALLDLVATGASAPLFHAAIVLAVWVGLTGALHLDGWADCCDALLVPADRERRLRIMKDPHLGGFGVVGLVLLLLMKLAALQVILGSPSDLLIMVAVTAAARWAVPVAAFFFPAARPGGMGDHFRRGLTRWGLSAATVIAVAAVSPLLLHGAVVIAAAALACIAVAFVAKSRLGGLTGDVYGAIVESAETFALVVLAFLV